MEDELEEVSLEYEEGGANSGAIPDAAVLLLRHLQLHAGEGLPQSVQHDRLVPVARFNTINVGSNR